MDDMLKFYYKLLVFQTILYAAIYFAAYRDGLINDDEILGKLMIIVIYIMAVITTFVIPVIKYIKNKKNGVQ